MILGDHVIENEESDSGWSEWVVERCTFKTDRVGITLFTVMRGQTGDGCLLYSVQMSD